MKKNNKSLIFTAIIASLVFSIACADKVILKDGQTITGDILAEKDTAIVIDLGFHVLSVPREKIQDFEYTKGYELSDLDTNDVNNGPVVIKTEHLYKTATLKKTTIEKCVDAVSEAVVKISTPGGLGSGFFLNEEGYLITNFHVIEKETKIEVTLFQKKKNGFEKKEYKKVKIIATNPFVDLALLKVEDIGDDKIKYVHLGDMDRISVGEKVFAIGTPLGLERTVTDGVISTKNRAFEGLVYIQTNTAINPGNSGGPLFNLAGEVIGVTNMGYIFYGGLGFAIPIDYVKHFIKNRESFAYDKDNPNSGYRYIQPDSRRNKEKPSFLKGEK